MEIFALSLSPYLEETTYCTPYYGKRFINDYWGLNKQAGLLQFRIMF